MQPNKPFTAKPSEATDRPFGSHHLLSIGLGMLLRAEHFGAQEICSPRTWTLALRRNAPTNVAWRTGLRIHLLLSGRSQSLKTTKDSDSVPLPVHGLLKSS
jgi:hypothetical protein